jgi:hypothetical protein
MVEATSVCRGGRGAAYGEVPFEEVGFKRLCMVV